MYVRGMDGTQREVSLQDVLYIPSYKQDIFSVQAATEKGATVNFNANTAELVAPDGTIFDINKSGKLYYLNSVAANGGHSCSIKEWHMIFGHCNVKDILKLEAVVEGMKITDKSTTQLKSDVCTIGNKSYCRVWPTNFVYIGVA